MHIALVDIAMIHFSYPRSQAELVLIRSIPNREQPCEISGAEEGAGNRQVSSGERAGALVSLEKKNRDLSFPGNSLLKNLS